MLLASSNRKAEERENLHWSQSEELGKICVVGLAEGLKGEEYHARKKVCKMLRGSRVALLPRSQSATRACFGSRRSLRST